MRGDDKGVWRIATFAPVRHFAKMPAPDRPLCRRRTFCATAGAFARGGFAVRFVESRMLWVWRCSTLRPPGRALAFLQNDMWKIAISRNALIKSYRALTIS